MKNFRRWVANTFRREKDHTPNDRSVTLEDAIDIMSGRKPALQMVEVRPNHFEYRCR